VDRFDPPQHADREPAVSRQSAGSQNGTHAMTFISQDYQYIGIRLSGLLFVIYCAWFSLAEESYQEKTGMRILVLVLSTMVFGFCLPSTRALSTTTSSAKHVYVSDVMLR
jgi:hypothetical protein